MNEEPQVITLSDNEIEITFPDNWRMGRQYIYLNGFSGYNRDNQFVVRVKI